MKYLLRGQIQMYCFCSNNKIHEDDTDFKDLIKIFTSNILMEHFSL